MPRSRSSRQPIGVLARERLDERRLAVVDVARGADRQRHARTAAATSSTSSSASVRQSSSSLPSRTIADDRRLAAPQRRGERLLERAREARQLGERQRAAADARHRLLDRAADRAPRAAPRGRAPSPPSSRSMRSTGIRSRRVEVEPQRPLERGERQLVRAQRALQRMAPQPLDEIGPADDDARLRAAEQLVAGEADEVGARGERLRRRRLAGQVAERAGAEVVDERQPVPPRDRRELRELRQLGEPDDAEVRLVHAQEERGLRADRALVVGGARAVRRADLDEPRAGAREHVGDAEAVADLDQLAARDEHLAALARARRARAAPRPRCC